MKIPILDRLGGLTCIICVIHCLVVSLGFSLLSTLELAAGLNEIIEWLFFSLAVGFALLSASFGYRVHQKRSLIVFFGLGILVLTTGRLAEAFELFEGGDSLAILGGLGLFFSHLWSTRCS